jgi:ABC-type sugar transport system ATPase subunit
MAAKKQTIGRQPLVERLRNLSMQSNTSLAASRDGIALVVISSYLPEVLALSDRIRVARQGRIVEEMDLSEATEARSCTRRCID